MKHYKLFSLLAPILLLSACSTATTQPTATQQSSTSEEDVVPGKKAPAFKLRNLKTGEIVTDKNTKNKKVYFDFFASWCGPCIENMPHIKELQNELKTSDTKMFVVVSPNHGGERSEEDFKKWLNKQNVKDIDFYIDENEELVNTYHVPAYPGNVLVDSKGVIHKMKTGVEPISETLNSIKSMP